MVQSYPDVFFKKLIQLSMTLRIQSIKTFHTKLSFAHIISNTLLSFLTQIVPIMSFTHLSTTFAEHRLWEYCTCSWTVMGWHYIWLVWELWHSFHSVWMNAGLTVCWKEFHLMNRQICALQSIYLKFNAYVLIAGYFKIFFKIFGIFIW